jgi:hypothetical protein
MIRPNVDQREMSMESERRPVSIGSRKLISVPADRVQTIFPSKSAERRHLVILPSHCDLFLSRTQRGLGVHHLPSLARLSHSQMARIEPEAWIARAITEGALPWSGGQRIFSMTKGDSYIDADVWATCGRFCGAAPRPTIMP